MTDFDAIAAKYGATDNKAAPDFDAIAAKFGSKPAYAIGAQARPSDEPALRMYENLGAGVDTLVQGVKQWLGTNGAMTDAQLKEKRSLDKQLADSTMGGGALQIAGETLPTLAIPGGVAARGFMKGAPLLATALESGGMGALLGAAQPVMSDESRGKNAALGGTVGAFIPAAVSAAIAPIRWALNAFSRGGAEAKAAQQIIDRVGGEQEARSLVAQVDNYTPHSAVQDVPMTPAEMTQSPALAGAEMRASKQFPSNWTDFRSEQAQARANALENATSAGANVGRLESARDAATNQMREDALREATPRTVGVINDVRHQVDKVMLTNPPSSDAYKMAKIVQGDLNNGTDPARLYETRKMLANKLQRGAFADPETAILRGARRETVEMIGAIDDALNVASYGKWGKYMDQYKSMSPAVDSATAQKEITDFVSGDKFPQIKGTVPGQTSIPELTGRNVGGLIEKGENDFGQRLGPDVLDSLKALQDNLRQTEVLQKSVKKSGTYGGGSQTSMSDALGGAAVNVLAAKTGTSPLLALVKAIRPGSMTEGALSDMMRDPDLFVRAVNARLAKGQPLTESQAEILRLARTLPLSAAANAVGTGN